LHYINLHFTYSLTHLLANLLTDVDTSFTKLPLFIYWASQAPPIIVVVVVVVVVVAAAAADIASGTVKQHDV